MHFLLRPKFVFINHSMFVNALFAAPKFVFINRINDLIEHFWWIIYVIIVVCLLMMAKVCFINEFEQIIE